MIPRFAEVSDFVNRRFFVPETFCGLGSYLKNTKEATQFITDVIEREQIETIIDIGCGDLNWMQHVGLASMGVMSYVGIDFDSEILDIAKSRVHEGSMFSFIQQDVRKLSSLNKCDLIICRDLLLHLKTDAVKRLLDVILYSRSSWLITNNYDIEQNTELDSLAEYTLKKRKSRKLNLCLSPYDWPESDRSVREKGCGHDRRLCLWNLDRVRWEYFQ